MNWQHLHGAMMEKIHHGKYVHAVVQSLATKIALH